MLQPDERHRVGLGGNGVVVSAATAATSAKSHARNGERRPSRRQYIGPESRVPDRVSRNVAPPRRHGDAHPNPEQGARPCGSRDADVAGAVFARGAAPS